MPGVENWPKFVNSAHFLAKNIQKMQKMTIYFTIHKFSQKVSDRIFLNREILHILTLSEHIPKSLDGSKHLREYGGSGPQWDVSATLQYLLF